MVGNILNVVIRHFYLLEELLPIGLSFERQYQNFLTAMFPNEFC